MDHHNDNPPDEERERRFPAVIPGEQVTQMRMAMVRIESKVDSIAKETSRVYKRVEAIEEEIPDLRERIIKIETFNGIILWVINGGWAVLVAGGLVVAKLGLI